ncbi:tRNA pseudouridine(38/39) synthase isoform X2 [Zophobas morio]|uniref:tRNA pseudouridine(38/39) synthase isoform X2 n=1 Tax=Zophobas morio TaxID=2755281 RepID=UPI0030827FB8
MDEFENYSREQLVAYIKSLKNQNTQLLQTVVKNDTNKKQLRRKTSKPFDFDKCKYRHVLLKFFYLGWDYDGYVTQEDTSNTVEHSIFKALIKTCLIKNRSTSNYHRCGRTDKGVSAFSQVISVDLRSKSENIEDELNYCKMLNSVLPASIQFTAWCPVGNNFSARFDCRRRTYKYFFPKGNLDVRAMTIAAKYLEGTHDFRNFCKMDVNNGVVEFVRCILSIDFSSFNEGCHSDDSVYVMTVTGNAFLWHQIRYIFGILILIGQHKEKPEIILELLDVTSNPRKPDYHLASEIPLNLYDCYYDKIDWIYDQKSLKVVASKLQEMWTFSEIKKKYYLGMIKTLNF